jgi:hypothetical protein
MARYMTITRDKMQQFVDHDPTGLYTNPKHVWQLIAVFLIFALPSSLLGLYASITQIIFVLVSIALVGWGSYLSFRLSEKRYSLIHFMIYVVCAIWMACLLGAYKIASTVSSVSISVVLITLILSAVIFRVSNINRLKRIAAGQFEGASQNSSPSANRIVLAYFIGASLARVIFKDVSQLLIVYFIAGSLLLIASAFIVVMAKFTLKAYFFRQLNHR